MARLGREGSRSGSPHSELWLRTASSLALALIALVSAWIGGWLLGLVWLGAGAVVAAEWLAMTRATPTLPLTGIAWAGLAGLQAALSVGSGLAMAVVFAAAGAAMLVLASSPRDRLWATSGFCYAAGIALVPVALRSQPTGGFAALLWMFAVVWATDVAAYFTGRVFGGPKLWPAVSPGKTWSGFAGGLAGATLAGLAVALVAERAGVALPLSLPAIAVISAFASVASQLGDLGESAMKRRFGVKDSGALIPGHGGFMDRLDGFAAVALLAGFVLVGASATTHPAAP